MPSDQPPLDVLLRIFPGFIWTADTDGEIQYISPRFSHFVGHEAAFFKKRYWSEFIHGEDLPNVHAVWDRANQLRGPYRVICRFLRHDGVWRWINLQADPHLDTSGRIDLWYGHGDDINDQVETANALRDTSLRLQEASRQKDEFLATLAHELRNPLAPIRQAVTIARSNQVSRDQSDRSLEVIDRQVGTLALLVDDLLDLSRITRGRLQLRKEMVNLEDVLATAVETVQPHLERCRQHLHVEQEPKNVRLSVDPLRIAQVVTNLLHNASKYSAEGGTIRLYATTSSDKVVIRVVDQGIGIEGSAIARVFGLFSQISTALDKSEGGLGIGLAIVRGVVELHGGLVSVHSEGLGKGSEFRVELPRTLTTTGVREIKVPAPPSGRTVCRKILVADDNLDAVETLRVLLEFDGHTVLIAHNGEEAVQIASATKPEVVILDIGMPVKNGYEAAIAIRAQPWSEMLTLIAITGWGHESDRAKAETAGFDRHMTKPVDFNALRTVLAEL